MGSQKVPGAPETEEELFEALVGLGREFAEMCFARYALYTFTAQWTAWARGALRPRLRYLIELTELRIDDDGHERALDHLLEAAHERLQELTEQGRTVAGGHA